VVIVTDIKWVDNCGEIKEGFYMDGYLAENLYHVSDFVKKDRDFVFEVSGHGFTRCGKSTLLNQMLIFIAWRQAGGEMSLKRNREGTFINPRVTKSPKKKIKFDLNHLAFDPEGLMYKGTTFPKESLIGFDEGKQGLDSKGTMSATNKALDIFFQEVGVKNHIIGIVLPNFFKLNEDIATTRSMFLVDTYHDKNWKRGFFSFYGPRTKEWLYFMGKKKIGVGNKYASINPDFFGRFTDWSPFNKEEYETLKSEALKKKTFGTREQKIKTKYLGLLDIYKKETNETNEIIAKKLSEVLFTKISPRSIEYSLQDYRKYAEKMDYGGDVS
jgi:hypothetical protein